MSHGLGRAAGAGEGGCWSSGIMYCTVLLMYARTGRAVTAGFNGSSGTSDRGTSPLGR